MTYPPGGRLGPRRQHAVELVIVHAGSARITVDGAPRAVLHAGWAGLLLPGHSEQFAFDERVPTHHSWIQGRLAAPAEGLLDRLAAVPAAVPASAALGDLVRAAVGVARGRLPTATELIAALGAAAIWRYAGEAESHAMDSGGAVERARAFLDVNLSDPRLDLEQVARAAHVTPAHLVRRFRAELGITPMAFLWQRRVALGVDLLVHTGLPVGEIAARAGFKSVYHFSRRVKAHTGASPTQVRRERWAAGR